MECWPRYVDPTDPATGEQYPGWPKTITAADNDGRKAVGNLPTLELNSWKNPVVQVIDQSSGEIVSTQRVSGNQFQPKVFAEGTYRIRVGDPDLDQWTTVEDVRSSSEPGAVIQVTKTE